MMRLNDLKKQIPPKIFDVLERRSYRELRPSQVKSIRAGLFKDKNLLVCTPTASGKTLVAELAALNAIYHDKGKAIYVVPLRALASEKLNDFQRDYSDLKIALTSGDRDSADSYLERYDWIVTTSEKLDSLLRHQAGWLKTVRVVILDEIHLLNDPGRGPTLEVLITLLRKVLKPLQVVALSATIGNAEELANWLDAKLVLDDWRPVRLDKGIYLDSQVEFW